ncbi:MAG: NADPH:quinone reductase [Atopostipes sp.]|nr:NADPH:quinone reductase [Atopostipes sp.]
MKAVQIKDFGGPEVLKTASVDEPKVNKNEVKVKNFATGLNPNESYTITGTYGDNPPELPYIPGFDGAGVVEELGENVEDFKLGDRVWIAGFKADRNSGTYAEKVVIDANHLHPLPDNLSMNEGASLGIPVLTAYRTLFQRANITDADTVFIHGASGAVGSFAVQMAKAIGAKVIGSSSTKEGRQEILDLGADEAMNHITEDNKDHLMKITDGKGPDVIIEMLANVNLEVDTQVIADTGRIVVVGNRGTIEIDPRNLMGTEALVTAVNVGKMPKKDKKEALLGIFEFLRKGQMEPLVGKKFTLEEATAAHKHMMEDPGNGRTLLVIDEE